MTDIEFKQYLREFREYRWTGDEILQKARLLGGNATPNKGAISHWVEFDRNKPETRPS